jgi:hypothetical protein
MFPQPAFCDSFTVEEAKLTGKHRDQLNMVLTRDGVTLRATRFRFEGTVPKDTVKLIYKLALHRDKRGRDELRLLVDHIL